MPTGPTTENDQWEDPMRRPAEPMATGQQPVVVVAGCGFGGLATLKQLSGRFRIIAVDRNIYTTFQPLLYQVATAGLAPSDVAYSLRAIAGKYGARFRRGELTDIDPAAAAVSLADGTQLRYDYLILATGSTAAFYDVAGAAEHSRGLYTRRDAIRLRDELTGRLEQLATAGRGASLVVTIVGGNATGVEMAGSLAELRNTALRTSYPEIDPDQVRLIEQLPDLARTGSSRSATLPPQATSRSRSSPSPFCRWDGTPHGRSATWPATSRRCRSATTTRGSWRLSAGGRPWCS
jgi:NADH dehydrogenase FAD-containing subunit